MRITANLAAGGHFVLILAMAVSGCGKMKQADPRDVRGTTEAKRQQTTCGSLAAYDRVKGVIFDQAIQLHRGSRANLDTLADYSSARMEHPIVKQWDDSLQMTRCQGHLILDVPPGAERGLAGDRHLQADIEYSAQAAADGSGLIYKETGAEQIVARLAAFNLGATAYRPPPAIDEAQSQEQVAPTQVALARASVPATLPAAATKRQIPTEAKPLPPQPATLPSRSALNRPPVMARAPARSSLSTAMASRSASMGPKHLSPQRGTLASQSASDRGPLKRNTVPAVSIADNGGEATVRGFYSSLAAGNGTTASAMVVPEKRSSRAFSPQAISRFYRPLAEPIRLTNVTPLAHGAYRVSYRYSTGRSRCNGSAVVSVTNRNGRGLIRSIRALNGC